MEGRFAVPFHFAVEFLVLVVAIGAALDAVRARRNGAGPWALGQALGFLLLAGAQAMHGALIAQADGDQVVVALRTAAFVSLALFARPAASVVPLVAASATPALFIPGAGARMAIAPAVAAVAVAARGVAAHRRDQDPSTFAFAAAFFSFAAAEAAVIVAPEDGGGWIIAAHAARALGAMFLARWLWSSIVRSVRMRTVAAFVIVLTVGVLVVSAVLNVVIGDTLQTEELKRLADAGRARVGGIQTLVDSATSAAGALAENSALASNLVRGPSGTPVVRFVRLLPANANFLLVLNAKGKVVGSAENVIGRSAYPLLRTEEISVAGTPVVREALAGASTSSSAVPVSFVTKDGELSEIVVIGASSVRVVGRGVVGAVVVGYRLGLSFIREVAQDTGLTSSVFADEGSAQGGVTLLVGQPPRLAASTFDELGVRKGLAVARSDINAAASSGVVVTRFLSVGETPYATAFVPVVDVRRNVIGLLVLSRRTAALAAAQRNITRTLFLVTLLAVGIAALLAWTSGGRVTRPIRALTEAARELRQGNLQARTRVGANDEVGTLGAAFNEMADELQRKTGDLRTAASSEATLRARMEAVLQSMGDGLIATDVAGVIVTCNRAAERMLGKRAERVIGRRIADVLQGTAGGHPLADVAMRGAGGEGTLRGADGVPVTVALTAAPLLDAAGEPTGRVIVLRDVSREHEAERMKSEFLSNVSHELRTPITPIKGYAEIMKRKQFPREKAEQFLEGILASTDRLERIVEILVDFAAMEAGRLKPRSEPVPVRGLLDGVTAKWRKKDATHQFIRKGGVDVPPIRGDARLLGRSLDELIDNAVKFSPNGGKIEIGAEPFVNGARSKRVSKIRITVRDHGIGIEPARMPDLFRDFRQLDGSETRTYGGLGLGLAYVKRIAAVHGGEVLVESKPGRGSAFSLVLPIAEAGARTVRKPPAPAPARSAKRAPSRKGSGSR